MKFFTLLYALAALALYLLALPLLVVLAFKAKYRQSIPARFFLWNNPRFTHTNIWFHACSLGETKALAPVIDALKRNDIGISTITHTGYKEAARYGLEVRYLPYEIFLPFWIKKPKMLVVLEAEFWYLLFVVASARGAKIVLLNARISERSFEKYLRMAWFYRKIFVYCDKIYVQSEADKNRFVALGALHVEILGNIKLAQKIEASRQYAKPEREVIVAASTHEGEEAAILEAFKRYRKTHDAMLIVVPRHPERFEKVWDDIRLTCKSEALSVSRWSSAQELVSDVVLMDAMGELNNIYAISDIAVLGGAFKSDVGGHNPLEPAHFGCKIITGTHFFNQKELFKYVHHVQYVAPEEIFEAFCEAQSLPPSVVDETIKLEKIVNDIKEVE